MKALLILVWFGGHGEWNTETVWFSNKAACEKAKPVIIAAHYSQFQSAWYTSNKAVCVEVEQ